MSEPSPTILQISDLSVAYATPRGAVRALAHVDLTVPRGEIVGIVGESGSAVCYPEHPDVTSRQVLAIRRNFTTITEHQALDMAEDVLDELEAAGLRIEKRPPAAPKQPA
jgi:ABC-type microcin C transport system duplicated ATPase subunit YejF